MFQWKWKEAVVFDIIFCLTVNTVRKIAVAKASWLMLSSSLRCCSICRITRLASSRPRDFTSRVELAKSELPVRNLRTIEKVMQTYVTRLFACSSRYFRPRWKSRQQQVWGKKFLGQIVPGNFGGKAAMVFRKSSKDLRLSFKDEDILNV